MPWNLFSRGQLKSDLAEEMRQHLSERADEWIAQGVPPAEARARAHREFGNLALLEEKGREFWSWPHLDALAGDVRLAVRRLRQSPGLTVVCVLTLALGLGANLALFSLVQTVLLNPLPFPRSDRLLALYESNTGDVKTDWNAVAGGSFAEWQRGAHGFQQMALWGWGSRNLAGQGGQLPEQVPSRKCTWNLFETLGVHPIYGRSFSVADDKFGAPATTILTWGLFQRRFGGDPSIVGRNILLDAQPHTVIGVLPSWFTYPDRKAQLWTPVYRDTPAYYIGSHAIHSWNVVGRLKDGVSAAAATKEVSAIQSRVHRDFPGDPAALTAASQSLLEEVVGEFREPLYVLLVAVGCVLLITCLNVSSLLLARSAVRRREIAIRSALGGSVWRIAQEQLIESLLLAIAGGALAVSVAYGLLQWIVAVRQDLPRTESLRVDLPILAFGFALILITGLLAGVLPALSFRGDSLRNILQEATRSLKGGRSHTTIRKYMVAVEVAFTTVLLIGAGLLLKSFVELRSVPLGVKTTNVLTMSLSLPEEKYKERGRIAAFFADLLTRVRAIPGVESAGLITTLPGLGYAGDNGFTIPGRPPLPKGTFQFALQRAVDTDIFHVLGIPVLQGRAFNAHDRKDNDRLIVNAAFAMQQFPNENPIGKLVHMGGADQEIIGVVGDTRYLLYQPPKPATYLLVSDGWTELTLAVRAKEDPLPLALPIQKLVGQLDNNLGVADIMTLDDAIGETMSGSTFEAFLVSGFAVLALLLASIGLYGVLSYVVTQRTSEIGIRIALGAQRGGLIWQTLIDGVKPALFGLILGVAGAVAVARLIQGLLFGVRSTDFSVFAAVSLGILLVSAIACALPAIRAASVDPVTALRKE